MVIPRKKGETPDVKYYKKIVKDKEKELSEKSHSLEFSKGSYLIRLPKELVEAFGWKEKDKIKILPTKGKNVLFGSLILYKEDKYPNIVDPELYILEKHLKDTERAIKNRQKNLNSVDSRIYVKKRMKKKYGKETKDEILEEYQKKKEQLEVLIKLKKIEITETFTMGHEELPDDLEKLDLLLEKKKKEKSSLWKYLNE